MTDIPATTYLNDARDEGEFKTGLITPILNVLAEILGGAAESELTVSGGSITPTAASHTVDTESDAASDDLDNIATTNHPESRFIILRCADASRVTTIKHESGGAGQIHTGGSDIDLDSVNKRVLLQRVGADWYVVAIFHAEQDTYLYSANNLSDLADPATAWSNLGLDPAMTAVMSRAKFTYSDTDELTVGPGVYYHSGTTNQVVHWDSDITFQIGSGGTNGDSSDAGTSQWQYLYIDDSAVVTLGSNELTATELLNSTTAPTWSDAKAGFYNGNDRCVFAFYIDGSGNIEYFYHDGGDFVQFDELQATNINDTDVDAWTDCVLVIPLFGCAQRAVVAAKLRYVDGNMVGYWRTNGSSATDNQMGQIVNTSTLTFSSFPVTTDANGKIEVLGNAANNSTIYIWTVGWFLPRGI